MPSTLLEIAKLPALIDTVQVARILNCHQNSVMRMCREGRFQAARIGKEWRINTADFIRWAGLEEDVEEVRRELGEPSPDSSECQAPRPVVPVISERAGCRHIRFVPSHEDEVLIG